MKIFRQSAAPYVPTAARRIAKTAPELWAEQERRRKMLLDGDGVELTYRPASPLPPSGEFKRIVMTTEPLEAAEPRELRFVAETTIKTFMVTGQSISSQRAIMGPWVTETMQACPCIVADAGDGLVLGYVLYEGDLIHCLYVKSDFRGLGIGLGLLRAAGVTLPLRCQRVTRSWVRWTKHQGIPYRMEGDEQ